MLNIYITPGSLSDKVTENFISKASDLAKREKRSLILVPEQSTVFTERMLLKSTDASINFYSEVLNFSRLPNKAFREIGSLVSHELSKGERAVLMYSALSMSEEKLDIYKDNASSARFTEKLIKKADSFALKGITTDVLGKLISDNYSDNDLQLFTKLSELRLILSVYDTLTENIGVGKLDEMTRLAEELSEYDLFSDTEVIIDGFYGFSVPELSIIKQLIIQAESVDLSVICTKEAFADCDTESGIFADSCKLIKRLIRFCETAGCDYDLIFAEDLYTQASDEITALSEKFDRYDVRLEGIPKHFTISSHKNAYEELVFCAKEINRLIRTANCRFSDIAVVFRDRSKYEPLVKMVFDKYSVPYFKTDRRPLSESGLARFLISAVKIASGDLRRDSVLSYIRSGMTSLSRDEIFELTDYAVTWNISGKAWMAKNGFTMNPAGLKEQKTDEDNALLERINASREKVFTPLMKLTEAVNTLSIADVVSYLPVFLEESGAYSGITEECQKLKDKNRFSEATETALTWNSLNEALKGCFRVLSSGEYRLSVKRDLANILSLSMSGLFIGRIPSYNDCVNVGPCDFVRFRGVKYLFSVGMDADVFPQKTAYDDFFTQRESEALSHMAPEFEISQADTSSYDDLLFHLISSAPSEKLYMSYYTQDGSKNTAGKYISCAMRLFPDIPVRSIEDKKADIDITCAEDAFEKLISSSPDIPDNDRLSLLKYFKTSSSKRVSPFSDEAPSASFSERLGRFTFVKDFYKNRNTLENNPYKDRRTINISQSRLNTYNLCKYSYFLKYILKAQPAVKTDFGAADIGNFIHTVLERFFREIFENGEDPCALSRSMIRERVENTANEYIDAITSGSRITSNVERIKNILINSSVKVLDNIIRELKESKFIPILFEHEIGTENGVSTAVSENGYMNFAGRADRIDLYKAKDDTYYIRITDYKTSSRKFDISDIHNGLNLQLLIYLFALCRSGLTINKDHLDVSPAGVLYMTAAAPMISAKSKSESDTFLSQADKKLVRDGLLLNDPEILSAMEKSGNGIFIPVKLDSEGNSKNKKKVCSSEEFKELEGFINKLLKKTAAELKKGNIRPDPFCDSDISCTFCEYKAICKYEGNSKDISKKRFLKFDDTRQAEEMLFGKSDDDGDHEDLS
ncbi:MAG: hypothetical protein E7665_09395 [Ruminococcaceae bacterium]|nr:hypothetical protein [Oscillospiraceae bacterium]